MTLYSMEGITMSADIKGFRYDESGRPHLYKASVKLAEEHDVQEVEGVIRDALRAKYGQDAEVKCRPPSPQFDVGPARYEVGLMVYTRISHAGVDLSGSEMAEILARALASEGISARDTRIAVVLDRDD